MEGRNPSVGQLALDPVQNSATSQSPIASRHMTLDGSKRLVGQFGPVPSQNSGTSQSPAGPRHSVPDSNMSGGQAVPEDAEGRVLSYATSLAESFQAHLNLVHATSADELSRSCPGVTDALRKRCSIEETVVKGDPAKNLLRVAIDLKPDLIVMGGRRWVSVLGEFFSTTTERVLRATETSLLVVPIKDVEEKEQ